MNVTTVAMHGWPLWPIAVLATLGVWCVVSAVESMALDYSDPLYRPPRPLRSLIGVVLLITAGVYGALCTQYRQPITSNSPGAHQYAHAKWRPVEESVKAKSRQVYGVQLVDVDLTPSSTSNGEMTARAVPAASRSAKPRTVLIKQVEDPGPGGVTMKLLSPETKKELPKNR